MGALANDPSSPSSGPKIPDLDLFRESLMDLGDMNLSDSLIQLADGCREKNDRQDKVFKFRPRLKGRGPSATFNTSNIEGVPGIIPREARLPIHS